jgi:hypothetical protein
MMPNGDSSRIDFTDYFLEEIYNLTINSKNDEVSKTKILGILYNHTKNCSVK